MITTVDAPATKVTLRAEKIAALKASTIFLPIITELHERLDEMREDYVASPGDPALMLRILGPSGVGKSKILKSYIVRELKRTGLERHQIRVLYVELDEVTSILQFYRMLLIAAGASGVALTGDLHVLKHRALEYLRRLGIELILIDEAHHLWNKAGAKTVWNKTEALKSACNAGFPPMVFAGIETADSKFTSNLQLGMRQEPPITLEACKYSDPDGAKYYAGFCGQLDKVMMEKGIVDKPAGLLDDYLAHLYQASGGFIGVTFNIVLHALKHALRKKRSHITRADLAFAVENWAMKEGFAKTNPFTRNSKGPK